MSTMSFPRWLAGVGVLGGVVIALVLPYIVLIQANGLTSGAKLTLVILALLAGTALAGVSTVVGIALPTQIKNGALGLAVCEPECQPCETTETPSGTAPESSPETP
jgi:hypothetical protein